MNFPPIPETLTDQSVYDHVCACLAIQKRRSANVETCLYRGPGGARCAVGHLIPDDKYDERMDGPTMDLSIVLSLIGVKGRVRYLLHRLQRVHDEAPTADELRRELQLIATGGVHAITPGAEQAITEWVA